MFELDEEFVMRGKMHTVMRIDGSPPCGLQELAAEASQVIGAVAGIGEQCWQAPHFTTADIDDPPQPLLLMHSTTVSPSLSHPVRRDLYA